MFAADIQDVPLALRDVFQGRIMIYHNDTARSNFTESGCCTDGNNDQFLKYIRDGTVTPVKDTTMFVFEISALTPLGYIHRHARINKYTKKVVILERILGRGHFYVTAPFNDHRWSLSATIYDIAAKRSQRVKFSQKLEETDEVSGWLG